MTDTAAAPGAPAAEAQPESQPIVAAPQPEDKPSVQQRLKPIPNKPSLPGVLSDDDSDFFSAPVVEKAARATQEEGSQARGADGKFVSAAGQAKTDVDVPEPPDGVAPEPQIAPSKYVFEGEEFDSEDAFKQNFKSMRGSFKKNLERATQAEIRLGQAAESARAWKAEHDRILAERASQAPGTGPKTTTEPQASGESEGIDWELYAQIERIATEAGEPWKAKKWLHEQTEALHNKRVKSALDTELKPYREQQALDALGAQTEEMFGVLADYVQPDGSPTFPELHSEESAYEVGKLWASLGLPKQHALTTQGAAAAVALYRMIHGAQGQQAVAATMQSIPTGPRQEQLAAQAANIVGGRPDATPLDPDNHSDSAEASRIKAAMRKTSISRPQWGFEA